MAISISERLCESCRNDRDDNTETETATNARIDRDDAPSDLDEYAGADAGCHVHVAVDADHRAGTDADVGAQGERPDRFAVLMLSVAAIGLVATAIGWRRRTD